MAGLVIGMVALGVAEVVGVPIGGYVYSNHISKQKSWGSFGIGALGTAILIPVVSFSYVVYVNQRPQKTRPTP